MILYARTERTDKCFRNKYSPAKSLILTSAPALMSFLVCLQSPRMLAMCSGVSPRSFLLLTFLSRGVRLIDEPEVVELGDVGRGGVSEMYDMVKNHCINTNIVALIRPKLPIVKGFCIII